MIRGFGHAEAEADSTAALRNDNKHAAWWFARSASARHGECHQPRVCSRSCSAMAAAARPFMVPVTASLASATILGSLKWVVAIDRKSTRLNSSHLVISY